ncbi:hypothetical protein LguiB_011212 [Lonicera macranthoides]
MCKLNRNGLISFLLPVGVTIRLPFAEPVGGLLVYPDNELLTPRIDIVAHLQTKIAERNISNGKKINKNKESYVTEVKLTDMNSKSFVCSVSGRSYQEG